MQGKTARLKAGRAAKFRRRRMAATGEMKRIVRRKQRMRIKKGA